jgi:hypothetical protein
MRWLVPILVSALVWVTACSDRAELPEDAQLEFFISTMARCANIERAYSGNPEMMSQELDQVPIPDRWQETVDSLLATYGGDPEFWQAVYDEILERSRLPVQ